MARNPSTTGQRDLSITPFYSANSWTTLDLATAPGRASGPNEGAQEKLDLGVAADGDCLRQALLLRLLTPLGSLTELGHPDYGSRLHELIGRPSNLAARRLAKAFVLLALRAERRIEEVIEVSVEEPDQLATDTLRVFLRVQPANGLDPVALGIEVAL